MRVRCCSAGRVPPRACEEPMQMARWAGWVHDEAGASTKVTGGDALALLLSPPELEPRRWAARRRPRSRSAASVSTPVNVTAAPGASPE